MISGDESHESHLTEWENAMRMLLYITIPHEPFNSLARRGAAAKKLGQILDEIKPEAVYFTEQDGKRGAIVVVDMADPSKIPNLCEPWFLAFNADVKCRIAMTPDDLKKSGLDTLGKKWA
jgi:hypothetical protein